MDLTIVSIIIFCSFLLGTQFQFCKADDENSLDTVYLENEYTGEHLNIPMLQCSNLPVKWNGTVSTMSTNGQCVTLFKTVNCTGDHFEIPPSLFTSNHKVGGWISSRKVMSIGRCENECPLNATSIANNTLFHVDIAFGDATKGFFEELAVEGCTQLPERSPNHDLSINTYGQCIRLYTNNECNEFWGRNIELREDTELHQSMKKWQMTEAKSISHCNYKCTHSSTQRRLEHGEVALFDKPHFVGKHVKIAANDTKCHPLPVEFNFRSIQLEHNTCIQVYDDSKGCTENPTIFNESNPDLHSNTFAKYVKSCYTSDNNNDKFKNRLNAELLIVGMIFVILVICLVIRLLRKFRKGICARNVEEPSVQENILSLDELGNCQTTV